MKDLSFDAEAGNLHNVTAMPDMSIVELNEEAELDKVDFETLMEEIRAS